jgi:hypothetical protein
MTGIWSRLLAILGAALLAGPACAEVTSPPIVDFGPASGQCVLGVIDEPEPLPSGMRMTRIRVSCVGAATFPIVMWETWPQDSLGTVHLSNGSPTEEEPMTPSSRFRRPLLKSAHQARLAFPTDGPPSVVVSPATNTPVVAWSRRSPSGADVVTSRFANGAWAVPRVVARSPEDERDPQLVLGTGGTVYLLYWVDGPTPRVLLRESSGDLSAWSAPSAVSAADELALRPAGAFHDGALHVTYERHDLGLDRAPTNVVLARRDGDTWRSEVLAVSWSRTPLWPRSHSEEGRLWVDWDDGDGAAGWVRMDASGRWESPRYEPALASETRDETRLRALGLP